ncbi:PQQ-dependent sugar dehydrogenase [Halanaerobium sp. Z-7514]|uniref:PQQ-dependent sugar dehydrogenase n=1 Tax=Halanaerobium polyolivorans TaxID=2886943 RepID=A0AAW4WXA2_9FIRM|nr:PQQ-dependent sugar dehydrogenase [Halanaerobium polyolivorans]MCC3144596.1 PQQ-dependent sugar dehydrogenase [Halanaerobium polyolivorans]RQD77663.1 MAG: PQQ-dependent sugar dehydrogenase [Halanaerobium sp. MSAO_Bac5]
MKKVIIPLMIIFLLMSGVSIVRAEIRVGDFPQEVAEQFLKEPDGVIVESWVENLNIPWELVFMNEERALVSERDGRIRLIESGVLQTEPYLEIELTAVGEGGLMGMALHPDYPDKNYLYIMYTYRDADGDVLNRVSRFNAKEDSAKNEEILIEAIPGGRNHNGGRIAFGADGMLYITTGDSWNREISQDLNNLGGKILRLTPEGNVPEDNPYANSPVYSLGHRNPQGLAWHPETNDLFISDHGPSGEDGLRAKDRIKQVNPGDNFGWPEKIGYFEDGEYANPLIMWEDAVPPSGMTFYEGDLYVATLRSQALIKITFENNEDYHLESIERWFTEKDGPSTFGRLRTAVKGPDGYLYLLTSNRDGRGNPITEDDRIIRLKIED